MVDLVKFEREALYSRTLDSIQVEISALEEGLEEIKRLLSRAGVSALQDPDYIEMHKALEILRVAWRKRTQGQGAQEVGAGSLEGIV